ncbi:hypothetical protein LAZ67_10002813 [Cordylochernes scorpioides]|uniref:Uncharacterized protein n=1 Tax=Cordylochernes scorpioides TaxID=51811 RepID=A0ABY6L094_9ARAC|nr:hypothetical protein LAZ67_10002813 [Cordylochernes scorpioides]
MEPLWVILGLFLVLLVSWIRCRGSGELVFLPAGVVGQVSWSFFGAAGVVGQVSSLTAGVVGQVSSLTAGVVGQVSSLTAGVVGQVSSLTAGVVGQVSSLTAGVVGQVSSLTAGVVGQVSSLTAGVVGQVSSLTAGVVGELVFLPAGVVGQVSSLPAGVVGQAMKVGTRAERLVKSYPLTEANYPKVIEALKDRFGDKVILTEVKRKAHFQYFKKLNINGPEPNFIFGNALEYGFKILMKNGGIPLDYVNRSVAFENGEKWKSDRTILNPTFSSGKMKQGKLQISIIMNRCIDIFMEKLKTKNGGAIEAKSSFTRLTLDNILRSAFGIQTQVQVEGEDSLLNLIKGVTGRTYSHPLNLIASE